MCGAPGDALRTRWPQQPPTNTAQPSITRSRRARACTYIARIRIAIGDKSAPVSSKAAERAGTPGIAGITGPESAVAKSTAGPATELAPVPTLASAAGTSGLGGVGAAFASHACLPSSPSAFHSAATARAYSALVGSLPNDTAAAERTRSSASWRNSANPLMSINPCRCFVTVPAGLGLYYFCTFPRPTMASLPSVPEPIVSAAASLPAETVGVNRLRAATAIVALAGATPAVPCA